MLLIGRLYNVAFKFGVAHPPPPPRRGRPVVRTRNVGEVPSIVSSEQVKYPTIVFFHVFSKLVLQVLFYYLFILFLFLNLKKGGVKKERSQSNPTHSGHPPFYHIRNWSTMAYLRIWPNILHWNRVFYLEKLATSKFPNVLHYWIMLGDHFLIHMQKTGPKLALFHEFFGQNVKNSGLAFEKIK